MINNVLRVVLYQYLVTLLFFLCRRKNFIILKDLQESLGKSRNSLIKMLKRTEIRKVPWLEFCKEVSKSSLSKLSEPLENSCTEQENIELVPLNWNVRSLLKIRSKNIAL